jgi:hypothetical protein
MSRKLRLLNQLQLGIRGNQVHQHEDRIKEMEQIAVTQANANIAVRRW